MTDWFSPSSGQQRPQQPMPPRPQRRQPPAPQQRPVPPDHQVWPPVPPNHDPVGSSTQPLPVVPSAGPLPQRPPQPPVPPSEPPTGATEAPQAPPPKRPRLLLQGIGAVAALAVAIGAPTFDHYLEYKTIQRDSTIHAVAAGQEITFEHVTWKVSYATMQAPAGTKHNTPDKQWLRIDITRKAVDKDGAQLTGQPEVLLKDSAGRAWELETLDDKSPADHVVGESYVTTKVAIVPSVVAKEVELELRPNSYRSDTSIKDLMKPTDPAADDDILRFRR
ncbi:hypothetical protein ACFXJ8_38500 [Nonomuraea sp. NPDC059194]|uniref:hypothetical protein n=1 Tax=Nonomuraea sp. NPDC059194 TaxID=3346764 RepID=UPI00367F7FC6